MFGGKGLGTTRITAMLWEVIIPCIYVAQSVAGNVYTDDRKRFRCPLDPITDRYADPTDPTCRNYFLCHLGHAFPQRCNVRRAFHPQLKECFPRYQIPENLCTHPVDCDRNGYMSDPEDCTKYYICFFRQAIHYACEVNYYFDPKKNLCVKNKQRAKSCEKPKPQKGPDPREKTFQRNRFPLPEHVRGGPNPPNEDFTDDAVNAPSFDPRLTGIIAPSQVPFTEIGGVDVGGDGD